MISHPPIRKPNPARVAAMMSLALGALVLSAAPQAARAQSAGVSDPLNGAAIEAIRVVVVNPGPDAALADRVADSVRRSLALFPGARFSKEAFDLQLARARRTAEVGGLDYDVRLGSAGGVEVEVRVTLGDSA
ncbi:MAG: hypothetical protein ACKOD3_10765, partial [Phenylobacterium sp.]